MTAKIWANSADSHVLEPVGLWKERLPAKFVDRAPWVERDGDRETIYVDGKIMSRHRVAFADAMRPPGAGDVTVRMQDLDDQGIWAELLFPSRGLWLMSMTDRDLQTLSARVYNEWCAEEFMSVSPRLVGTALLPPLDTNDAVDVLRDAIALDYRTAFLPTTPPPGRDYNDTAWEPLWAFAESEDIPLCFHVGTGMDPKVNRGPGGAVINYVETFFPAQRTVTHLVAGGVLDRHPGLRVFVAEGGASWIPALVDRMEEAYRQHDMFVDPTLSMMPGEFVERQVYTSFQHDRSAIPCFMNLGYHNVMWGSDYPHLEGTFPETQRVLEGLFDGIPSDVREDITVNTFERLFPQIAEMRRPTPATSAGSSDR